MQCASCSLVRQQMPKVKVVEMKGHHFLFISNQDEVVGEMRRFLLNGQ